MKATTFEIEQFLDQMPACQARTEAIKKGKSALRRAWNGLRRQGYEPFHIGYQWIDTHDFNNAKAALSVTGYNPSCELFPNIRWELEEYNYPPARIARLGTEEVA